MASSSCILRDHSLSTRFNLSSGPDPADLTSVRAEQVEISDLGGGAAVSSLLSNDETLPSFRHIPYASHSLLSIYLGRRWFLYNVVVGNLLRLSKIGVGVPELCVRNLEMVALTDHQCSRNQFHLTPQWHRNLASPQSRRSRNLASPDFGSVSQPNAPTTCAVTCDNCFPDLQDHQKYADETV